MTRHTTLTVASLVLLASVCNGQSDPLSDASEHIPNLNFRMYRSLRDQLSEQSKEWIYVAGNSTDLHSNGPKHLAIVLLGKSRDAGAVPVLMDNLMFLPTIASDPGLSDRSCQTTGAEPVLFGRQALTQVNLGFRCSMRQNCISDNTSHASGCS